ncbi:MAG: hypothetical protein IJD39_10420 [Clostridia bacterium]|nr:hypothetical protein [Clostridia bacterium]
MKKRFFFFTCMILMLTSICAAAAAEDLILQDENLRVVFQKDGAITEISNPQTGDILLSGQGGDIFRVTIDASAKNIWRAQPSGYATVVMTGNDAATTLEKGDQSIAFTHAISLKKAGNVTFKRVFSLKDGVLRLASHIENGLSKGVVIYADPVVLSGFDHSLHITWPYHEGEHYEYAAQQAAQGQMTLTASYPSPLSMQWVSLYNGKTSLYFSVHDPDAVYKTFTFSGNAGAAELSCAQSPFLKPGAGASLADTVIAAPADDDWTAAADLYRSFIANETDWTRTPSDTAYETVGHYYWIMSNPKDDYRGAYVANAPNGEHSTMREYAQMLRTRSGATTMAYLGWHDGGFDTDFPDYDFSQAQGGEEGFRQAMKEIEDDGNVAMIYFNVHTAEIKSEWYSETGMDGQQKGYSAATLTEAGEMIEEIYWAGYGLQYYAMCPMADDYVDAIAEGVERVLASGADAAFLDQLMEMPAYLCFNPMHGHTSPATAYYEGYSKMMGRLHEIFEKYDVDPYFACEGICDAHMKWIDVCGLQGGRLFNSYEAHYPWITRYSLPTKVFGMPSDTEFGKAQYGRAWLMGSPFFVRENFNEILLTYTGIYKQYFDVFTNGQYQHTEGIDGIPDGLMVSLLISKEHPRGAVQVLNPTLKPIEASLNLSLPGQITSVTNLMTGEKMELVDGRLNFTTAKWESGSYLITWSEE